MGPGAWVAQLQASTMGGRQGAHALRGRQPLWWVSTMDNTGEAMATVGGRCRQTRVPARRRDGFMARDWGGATGGGCGKRQGGLCCWPAAA